MKKNSGMLAIVGLVALCATLCAFLFPLAPGLVDTVQNESYMGYNFVFGNNAQGLEYPFGGMIAAFALLIIGGSFQLLGFIFSLGQGGAKFSAFLHIVGGLSMIAAAVLFFLAKIIVGEFIPGTNLVLGWGFIAAGASAAVSGLLSVVPGFIVMKQKD